MIVFSKTFGNLVHSVKNESFLSLCEQTIQFRNCSRTIEIVRTILSPLFLLFFRLLLENNSFHFFERSKLFIHRLLNIVYKTMISQKKVFVHKNNAHLYSWYYTKAINLKQSKF